MTNIYGQTKSISIDDYLVEYEHIRQERETLESPGVKEGIEFISVTKNGIEIKLDEFLEEKFTNEINSLVEESLYDL